MKDQLYLSPYRIIFLVVIALAVGLYFLFAGINNIYYNERQMKIAIERSDFVAAEKYYLAGVPDDKDGSKRNSLYRGWVIYLVDQNEIELANTMAMNKPGTRFYFREALRAKIKRNYTNNSKLPTTREITLMEDSSYDLVTFFIAQGQYDTARQIAMMEYYDGSRDQYLKKIDKAQGIKPSKK